MILEEPLKGVIVEKLLKVYSLFWLVIVKKNNNNSNKNKC